MEDVSVLDQIIAAFEAHLAQFFDCCFRSGGDKIGIGNGLSANETFLKIGVNRARRLRRLGALLYRPGVSFLGADGEEGEQTQ